VENGAFFINKIKNILTFKNRLLGKIAIYEMLGFTSLDIDEPDDWIIAEILMKKYILNIKNSIKNKTFCNRCRWCIN